MAERLNLSPRHFTRVFRAEMGVNPSIWLEEVRLAEARRLLQSANGAPKRVAAACGYADANSLRRSFQRAFGTTPAQFRRTFTRGP
jgi:transcriptional regulator GlxA family with amidase domain